MLENTRFQQFTNESGQILLTVSGIGEIAAASAVSSVCTQYPPGQDDFLLNAGCCAGKAANGSIFLIHKLTEHATGKTFYPDIIYKHGLQETEIVTGMVPWKQGREDGESPSVYMHDVCLYDMEAAAVYQAGAYFFGPHQMMFVKVVSDSGEGDWLSGEFIRQLMEMHKDVICNFVEHLLLMAQSGRRMEQLSDSKQKMRASGCAEKLPQPEQWIHRLCADMHCSKAMEDSLRQYIRYAVLAGIDYKKAVQEMYQENRLPCKDKREGKRRFEELKQRLL